MNPNQLYMKEAIAMAKKAYAAGEYPIGAVIVLNDQIIAAAYPALDSQPDPTAHAEIEAIRGAARRLATRNLEGAVLYSTLEPCPMCTAAAIWAKCSAIVFGASQEDAVEASNLPGQSRKFRQIAVKARDIAVHGTPSLQVFEHFLRPQCIELLRSR